MLPYNENAMKILSCLIAGFISLMLVSCDSRDKYVVENGQVVWSYWTFSFGEIRDTVQGADAATFESLSYCYGKDKDRVYCKDRLIEGASPASFRPHNENLGEDDRDYYWKGQALHVVDKKTFEVLYDEGCDASWAKDAKNGYYIFFDKFVSFHIADYKSFAPATYMMDGMALKSCSYAIDKRKAYYEGIEVVGADVATFVQVDGNVAQDRNRVYYKAQPTDVKDYAQIHPVNDSLYTDSVYVYDKELKRVGQFEKRGK